MSKFELVLDLIRSQSQTFEKYLHLLLKWNSKINLTAITDPDRINELHFLDSLAPLPLLDQKLESAGQNVSRETFLPVSVLDIGAGAGFPGLPLKIVRRDIALTLIDAVKKKCDFMKEVVRQLHLKDVTIEHRRLTPEIKIGSFDLIISRAAFSLAELINLAIGQLKPEGLIVGMKTIDIEEELEVAKREALRFGLLIDQRIYELPGGIKRQLVVFRRG